MSIPPDSPGRGCAACYSQPIDRNHELGAECLAEYVYHFNCRIANPPLADIVYRSSDREEDVLHHVFRWNSTPYQEVFRNGFQARRQEGTTDEDYFNLYDSVHHGGRPLVPERPISRAFVSTTLNSGWHPTVTEGVHEVYRYEIYAPGGIWVAETLGDLYQYPSQDEVAFVAGIAPQYIRSAQRFRLINNGRYTRRERVDNVIILNVNYNPQSHPPRLLNIQRPVFDYLTENRTRAPLRIRIWLQRENREANDSSRTTIDRYARDVANYDSSLTTIDWYARDVANYETNVDSAIDWYAHDVANYESYINAAFRSSRTNEAYVFMKNEYILLNYAPGTTNDRVVNGPLLICDGYLSLTGTAFAEHGIDCAFGSHNKDQAFIFSGNLCALINFAPGTTDDKIIKGPMTITHMFPFLKGTEFESSVDAAFESSTKYEAYLFKDSQYALINYGSDNPHLIHVNRIADGFPSFRNTIFETGIDAAFSSHRTDEAYIFKGEFYALINFAPGTTNDKIIGGVKKILPNWPSLHSILPRTNRGIDAHYHTSPAPAASHQYHDET